MMILGKDKNGHTALQHCIKDQQFKNFDLMLKIVMKRASDYLISKLVISELPFMIKNPSKEDMEFFENCIYRTYSMQKAVEMQWNGEESEYFFASNTSLIDKAILQEEFPEESAIENGGQVKENDGYEEMKSIEETQSNTSQVQGYQDLMKTELREVEEDEGDVVLKKINVEALDFDWIFEHNNATNFISLLAKSEDHKILTTKSIKIFLSFMWDEYQAAIFKFMFLPTLLNTVLFIILCCGQFESFLDKKEVLWYHSFQSWFLALFCFCFTVFQLAMELRGMDDVREYLSDYWNVLDITSICLNFVYLSMVIMCLWKEDWVFERHVLQNMGAFACFLIWIKMFYWMRLFSTTAYYVKLITQTIWDCKDFMLMVLIIMIAFTCFFFMINLNQNGVDEYVDEYLGIGLLDAFIAAYFICLGEFAYDNYSKGQGFEEKYFVWGMFCLGSFLCCVVFMNMLIAIMGDTFGAVQEAQEENGLLEQLMLINDFIWLIDIEERYKNKKYLIRISTESYEASDESDIAGLVKSGNVSVMNKFEKLESTIQKMQHQQEQFAKNVEISQDELRSDIHSLVKANQINEERRVKEEKEKQIQLALASERRSKGDRITNSILGLASARKMNFPVTPVKQEDS